MAKRIWPGLLALVLALSGCASLLERDYSVVEPYADSYWDTEEDALRAESYQELVNSLLMLVEQRSEEGTIRFYPDSDAPYSQVGEASREVREETALGAYLVEEMSFLYQRTEDHCTLTWNIAYREGAADPDSLMTLSDAQSLVDLLRLAVREGHEKLTARFSYEIPRQEAIDAVEQLWRELCAVQAAPEEPAPGGEASGEPSGDQTPPEETEAPSDAGEETQSGGTPQEEGSAEEAPAAETEPEYPPCPWEIRFYPDRDTAEIVEILLAELPPVQAEAPTEEIR